MTNRNISTAVATKTAGRRTGRPTNAARKANLESKASQFITITAAAFANGMKIALGIDGGVQTLAGMPSGIGQAAGIGIAQGSQSVNAVATPKTKKAPGRKVQADSKLTKTREFYAQNLAETNPLNRADFVRKAAEMFGYSQQTANTYVSKIEEQQGYKLVRRGGASASRGRRIAKAA